MDGVVVGGTKVRAVRVKEVRLCFLHWHLHLHLGWTAHRLVDWHARAVQAPNQEWVRRRRCSGGAWQPCVAAISASSVPTAALCVWVPMCGVQAISIKSLSEKLNLGEEATEKWIVNLIR